MRVAFEFFKPKTLNLILTWLARFTDACSTLFPFDDALQVSWRYLTLSGQRTKGIS